MTEAKAIEPEVKNITNAEIVAFLSDWKTSAEVGQHFNYAINANGVYNGAMVRLGKMRDRGIIQLKKCGKGYIYKAKL